MSNYLIELALIHSLLIGGYVLLLRKERQYGKMRFYLLAGSVFSLLIPLLKLPNPFYTPPELVVAPAVQPLEFDVATTTQAVESSNWGLYSFLMIYAAVSLFFLYSFLESLWQIARLKLKSSREQNDDQQVQRIAGINGSFSFFSWIFLSREIATNSEEYDVILKHEQAHVTLKHTYDIIYFEFLKIFCWWLPSVWYAAKELKKIHEYQADAHALNHCPIDRYSSILISSTLKKSGLSMASSFHDGLIVKRLKAMKEQNKRVSTWKSGSLAALLSVLFVVFACSENPTLEAEPAREEFTIVGDWAQYPGGMDAFYQYLAQELKYPREARTAGVTGRTWVQFVVERDGTLSEIETVKGIGGGRDEEVVRVLEGASDFVPAQQRGRNVRVRMVVPVTFQLKDGETNPDGSPQGIIIVGETQNMLTDLRIDASYAGGEWTGTIYDEKTGDTLPGANIVVEGTTLGTVSDLQGNFKIKATEAQNLDVSFVGYKNLKLEAE